MAARAGAANEFEVHRGDGFLWLLLPPGALTLATAKALTDAFERAAGAEDLRVLVLASAGRDFCVGCGDDLDPLSCGLSPAETIASLRIPTIAVLGGAVRSVGFELALAADIRIAAADVTFALDDIAAGRLPCWGGTQRLVRVAGPSLATRMLMLGEVVTADAAHEFGLVHRTTPRIELEQTALDLCEKLSSQAPLALAYAKEAILEGAHLSMPDALRLEADLNVLLQASKDRAEGLSAFLSRRTPSFGGA
jgi:enoyl-CoA hydratase/carnithine racemase